MIIKFYFSIFQSEIVGHHNIAKGSFYQIWFERMIRIFYLMMIEDFVFRNHELHLWMITTNTDDQSQKGGLSNDNVFTDLFVFTLIFKFEISMFHRFYNITLPCSTIFANIDNHNSVPIYKTTNPKNANKILAQTRIYDLTQFQFPIIDSKQEIWSINCIL